MQPFKRTTYFWEEIGIIKNGFLKNSKIMMAVSNLNGKWSPASMHARESLDVAVAALRGAF